MGNVNGTGAGRQPDVENSAPPNSQQNHQVSRYAVVLGPMLGGSFPASVAIYIKDSSDEVKFFVFGGLTLGVFAVASGLVVSSVGTTIASVRYTRYAALVAVTVALSLFTAALGTLFGGLAYKIACTCVFGALILILDSVWLFLER